MSLPTQKLTEKLKNSDLDIRQESIRVLHNEVGGGGAGWQTTTPMDEYESKVLAGRFLKRGYLRDTELYIILYNSGPKTVRRPINEPDIEEPVEPEVPEGEVVQPTPVVIVGTGAPVAMPTGPVVAAPAPTSPPQPVQTEDSTADASADIEFRVNGQCVFEGGSGVLLLTIEGNNLKFQRGMFAEGEDDYAVYAVGAGDDINFEIVASGSGETNLSLFTIIAIPSAFNAAKYVPDATL